MKNRFGKYPNSIYYETTGAELLSKLQNASNKKKSLVLFGPPYSGKSYIVRLANELYPDKFIYDGDPVAVLLDMLMHMPEMSYMSLSEYQSKYPVWERWTKLVRSKDFVKCLNQLRAKWGIPDFPFDVTTAVWNRNCLVVQPYSHLALNIKRVDQSFEFRSETSVDDYYDYIRRHVSIADMLIVNDFDKNLEVQLHGYLSE